MKNKKMIINKEIIKEIIFESDEIAEILVQHLRDNNYISDSEYRFSVAWIIGKKPCDNRIKFKLLN